jgi:hypothetical protein
MTYAFLDTASLLMGFGLFYVFVHAYLLRCLTIPLIACLLSVSIFLLDRNMLI